jgi:hypothetical protein
MNTRRASVPLLAFVLPALALPLGLGLASFWALRPPPAPSADTAAEAASSPSSEERIYLPLITPITVSLPDGGPRLRIEIGVAIRAEGAYALLSRLKDRPEVVQSGLAEAVLRTAESLGPKAETEALRAALPDALRVAINDRLDDLGEERAVLEVLIAGWARAD